MGLGGGCFPRTGRRPRPSRLGSCQSGPLGVDFQEGPLVEFRSQSTGTTCSLGGRPSEKIKRGGTIPCPPAVAPVCDAEAFSFSRNVIFLNLLSQGSFLRSEDYRVGRPVGFTTSRWVGGTGRGGGPGREIRGLEQQLDSDGQVLKSTVYRVPTPFSIFFPQTILSLCFCFTGRTLKKREREKKFIHILIYSFNRC